MLYAIGPDSEDVVVIDTETNTVSQEIPLGQSPADIATDGIGGQAYTSLWEVGKVAILNATVIFIDGFETGDTSAW